VHITVVTRLNVFTCPCQQVNHGSLSTTHAYSVTYPFDCVSLLSTFRRLKTIFPQMLATTEQKPNLEQSTSELSKCLTVFFWCQNSTAVLPNERVWMSAMYWLMWLRIGLITSAAEVAWPWLISDGRIILLTINRSRRHSLKKLTIWWSKSSCWSVKKWENN